MAAAWQHNYWFWLAAACAVAGASAEWGPQWLTVEHHRDESSSGRPVEVIRHPGLPPTVTRPATDTSTSRSRTPLASPFPAPTASEATFDGPPESFLQLPNRTSANARAAHTQGEVRVAEFRQPWGTTRPSVVPIEHRPAEAGNSPVRLTGKIEPIFDE